MGSPRPPESSVMVSGAGVFGRGLGLGEAARVGSHDGISACAHETRPASPLPQHRRAEQGGRWLQPGSGPASKPGRAGSLTSASSLQDGEE